MSKKIGIDSYDDLEYGYISNVNKKKPMLQRIVYFSVCYIIPNSSDRESTVDFSINETEFKTDTFISLFRSQIEAHLGHGYRINRFNNLTHYHLNTECIWEYHELTTKTPSELRHWFDQLEDKYAEDETYSREFDIIIKAEPVYAPRSPLRECIASVTKCIT